MSACGRLCISSQSVVQEARSGRGTRYRVLLVLDRDRIRLEFMETSSNSTEVEDKGPDSRRIGLRGACVQSGL